MLTIVKTKYPYPSEGYNEIDKIINTVCNYFCQPRADIISKRRFRQFVFPRHIIIWLCQEYCSELSLKMIGKQLGGRDHTTIIHSREFVNGQLNSKFDNDFKHWVKDLENKLGY